MGRRKTQGLTLRGGLWVIDKKVRGRRIYLSTGTSDRKEAEEILEHRLAELRRIQLLGERPRRKWKEAATRHLMEGMERATIADDATHIRKLEKYIGDLWLDEVDDDALKQFSRDQLTSGRKKRTVNAALEVVRSVLNKAARDWRENRLSWLVSAPKITMLEIDDARPPYPISWDEQNALLQELPKHLQRMTLFALNTGCREQEICQLRREWIDELGGIHYAVIPKEFTKGGKRPKVVPFNRVVRSVVEEALEDGHEHVFVYGARGKAGPVGKMNNTAWKSARRKSGVPARVHDLRHTFAGRLLDLGVSEEMRARLLGHSVGSVTRHYSVPALQTMLNAVELLCGPRVQSLRLVV